LETNTDDPPGVHAPSKFSYPIATMASQAPSL